MQNDSILVVDDEEDTVELAKMVLEYEGFRVFSASNGEEAIDFLERGEEKPDLILLDVLMPKKNGLEVCKWIKQHPKLKRIPVLLFTAKVGKKDRIAGEEAGADAYINKPFSADDLLSLIRTHLENAKRLSQEN
ncbi:MAG: response regulator [Candidatus Hodarchaeota archaeon]